MGWDIHDNDTRADLLRRGLLAAGVLTPWLAAAAAPAWALEAAPPAHLEDFDFLVGRWRMHHHRLKDRLVGSKVWQDFGGSLSNQKLMGGQASPPMAGRPGRSTGARNWSERDRLSREVQTFRRRRGTRTVASPSMTSASPTKASPRRTTRALTSSIAATVMRVVTTSPMRTGAWKAKVWLR